MMAVFALGLVFLYVGAKYRSGGLPGVRASLQLEPLASYVNEALLVDIGQLHGIAGARRLPPGALAGVTFVAPLTWPISEAIKLPGKSVGLLVIESSLGFSGRRWGFAPSLLGDAYANFGYTGLLLVPMLFAATLRRIYDRFRKQQLSPALQAIVSVYAMHIFFGSIEQWPGALTTLGFLALMTQVSKAATNSTAVRSHGQTRSGPPSRGRATKTCM
jgi:hypothetical protein